jgi:hypothetical protein
MHLVDNQQFGGVGKERSEMTCLKKINKWKVIFFSAVCLLLSGCGRFDAYSIRRPITTFGGKVIYSGTQASFHCNNNIISLASANYYSAEFIDESGEKRTGNISGLSVTMKDKPEAYRFYSVYSGLTIYYYFVKIEILQVGDDFTEVEVSVVEQSGKTERCFGV